MNTDDTRTVSPKGSHPAITGNVFEKNKKPGNKQVVTGNVFTDSKKPKTVKKVITSSVSSNTKKEEH